MSQTISQSHIAIVLAFNATAQEVQLAQDLIAGAFKGVLGTATMPPAPTGDDSNNDDDGTPAAGIPADAVNADGTVKLDAEGLPWHAELHSGKGTQTNKGIWTKRKNRDEAKAAVIIAELRAKFPAPTATTATTAPVVAVTTPVIAVQQPVVATPYQAFVKFLADNTGAVLTQAIIDSTFAGNNTSLAALATADEGTLKAYRDALAGYLVQNGATVV